MHSDHGILSLWRDALSSQSTFAEDAAWSEQHLIPFIAASQLAYVPCKASNGVVGGKAEVDVGLAVFKTSAFSLLSYTQSRVRSVMHFGGFFWSPTLSAINEEQRDLFGLHK